MPIVLDYECGDCGAKILNYFKMSRDEPDPECPGCKVAAQKLPPLVALGTNKSRAVDIAQAEAESMGFTNMKDNLREGDSAAPSLPKQLQGAVDGFWGGASVPALGGNPMKIARSAAAMANAEGVNPVRGVQEAIRRRGRADGRPVLLDVAKQ